MKISYFQAYIQTQKYLITLILMVFIMTGCSNKADIAESSASSPVVTSSVDSINSFSQPVADITETIMNENESEVNEDQSSANTISTSSSSTGSSPSENQSFPPVSSATITVNPLPTQIPSRTPYPTFTRRPTRTPSITSTPKPPLAFFRINNLGPYSKVTSPIIPESMISPGQNGRIYIDLIGEDGREISKEVINYYNYIGEHFGIAPEIEFEIEAAAETGRLEISSVDRYNRTMWLTSVDLILLQMGRDQITPPQDFTEPYIIRYPEEGDNVQGGMLQVRGVARILNKNPLQFECIDQDGNLVASGEVTIHASSDGISHIPFEAYLPYQVTSPTNVRLSVRQESDNRLPGTISLSSFEITLAP